MLWFIYSLFAAISASTKDLFSKRGLKRIDEYIVAWSLRIFALPFLLPLLLFIQIPDIDTVFWYALLTSVSLNVITSILYMKAIKISPLSLTIPMIALTPMFLLLTSPLIAGEFPSSFGIIGIFLIVLGAYTLNVQKVSKGFLSPFKALKKEKGPIIMLCVAFIYSITANMDKVAIQHSSPFFFLIVANIFLSSILFPIVLFKSRKNLHQISPNIKSLVPIGLFSALTLIFQFNALVLAIVPYVISIKRTSIIFSSLYGFFIFKEKHMRERLSGAIIMVLGILLITLF